MFPVNLKKAGFALKNALILTLPTSTIIFMTINTIVWVLSILTGGVEYALDLPVEEIPLGYYWANLSLYAQIFSWVFAITLIQITIAKKVNNYEKSSYRIERESVKR